jgi:hypothetical protein
MSILEYFVDKIIKSYSELRMKEGILETNKVWDENEDPQILTQKIKGLIAITTGFRPQLKGIA